MNHIFLFDVDGTLTPARKEMNSEFDSFFQKWIETHKTFLVTGSDLEKTKEQVSTNILNKCEGVFCCMGNHFIKKYATIYLNNFDFPLEAEHFLKNCLNESKYPVEDRGDLHLEYRTGMVNFSVVGRNITTEQREKYYKWDCIHQERKKIAIEFNRLFMISGVEANIGGQISIDIQKIGFDKSQILNHIDTHGCKTVFFGDKCKPGEIDYPIYNLCDIKYEVSDWTECYDILKNKYSN